MIGFATRFIRYLSHVLDNDEYLFVVTFAIALIVAGIADFFIPMFPVGIIIGFGVFVWIIGRKLIDDKFKIW
jgi:hypothetical protein